MKPLQAGVYELLLGPITAATTARTATTSMVDCDYVTVLASAGAEANTNATGVVLTLAHGDDGTNFTTLSTTNLDNTAAAIHPFHVDTNGKKKLLKVTVTPDTTTNGAVLTAVHVIKMKDTLGAAQGTVV